MTSGLPDSVDAWRMVQAQRSFQGSLPLAGLSRLRNSLAAVDGVVTFDLQFDKDAMGVAHLHVRADAALPLTCQRTLEVFALPVHVDTKLGLITQEADEAALPGGYEPLLTSNGMLHLADVVEDEFILALPVVPVKPGTAPIEAIHAETEHDDVVPNPFAAALQELKMHKPQNK